MQRRRLLEVLRVDIRARLEERARDVEMALTGGPMRHELPCASAVLSTKGSRLASCSSSPHRAIDVISISTTSKWPRFAAMSIGVEPSASFAMIALLRSSVSASSAIAINRSTSLPLMADVKTCLRRPRRTPARPTHLRRPFRSTHLVKPSRPVEMWNAWFKEGRGKKIERM